MDSSSLAVSDEYLTVAYEAARNAAAVHEQYHGRQQQVEYKRSQSDFVTHVDREAEQRVRERILDAYPDHAIVGEEYPATGESEYVWYIDPLDGTTNYVHGYLPHCVVVALEIRDELHAGVVYDTYDENVYYAVAGEGAYQNDKSEPLRVSGAQAHEDALVAMDLTDANITDPPTLALYQRLLTETHGTRKLSCAGVSASRITEGRLDALVELGTKAWDVSAGVLLVCEAGGHVTDLRGSDAWADIREGYLVMSNGAVHEGMLQLCEAAGVR